METPAKANKFHAKGTATQTTTFDLATVTETPTKVTDPMKATETPGKAISPTQK